MVRAICRDHRVELRFRITVGIPLGTEIEITALPASVDLALAARLINC
jgi:hypothetical protein